MTTTNEELIAEARMHALTTGPNMGICAADGVSDSALGRVLIDECQLVQRLADALAAVPASTEVAWRKTIADQVRRNCTPSTEAYQAGGDRLIYAVADWVENPPEWVSGLSVQPVEGDKSPDFYRGYAIGCRDGETNAMRRIQVVQTNCALDAGNRIVAKRHDPHPIKVRNKVGDWVTTLPMSALGYHMPHEVQEFAPGAEFCQRPDHYFTVLGAAVTPDEQEGAE